MLDQPLTAFFASRQCPGVAIRLAMAWAVEQAAVISMDDTTRRLTAELAALRNDWVAEHATRIVVAHASTEGNLLRQATQWERDGQRVNYLS